MRITTWNINGLRTLRQYRPWYALKDWKACLDYLEADIICFQEVKLTRKALVADHRDMCVPEGYEAYYNLHPTKGYSGVATFVKKDVCEVRKAEMGLTGELVPFKLDEMRSIGGYPDERAPESPLYDQIDGEGRAVIVDCGMFVLFNLYCPNETDEGRREYKMAYYHTLAERVENLLARGREVIIVGDLNIAHLPIDHCEGVNQRTRQEHLDIHPARLWLDQFLAPNGAFHDITRRFHPTRKFMYTCWDTVKDTRPANYGVRIDYTLVSRGLLPWIKDANIQPNVYGSDHCPVYVDLHEEIQDAHGQTLRLHDRLMVPGDAKRKVPPLATSNWPEFVGRRIQSFFAPRNGSSSQSSPSPTPSVTASVGPSPSPTPTAQGVNQEALRSSALQARAQPPEKPEPSQPVAERQKDIKRQPDKASNTLSKKSQASPSKSSGQPNLRSFFQRPSVKTEEEEKEEKGLQDEVVMGNVKEIGTEEARETAEAMQTLQAFQASEEAKKIDDGQQATMSETESIYDFPASQPDSISLDDARPGTEDTSDADRVTSALAWGSIFAPKQPPLCYTHREPARAWTVNKPGPNHGRKFWMCSRPVGSGGTGKTEDDYPFRCSYWKWDSDIRSRASRQDRDADGSARSFHEVAGRAPRLGSGEKRGGGEERQQARAPHKSVSKRQKRQE